MERKQFGSHVSESYNQYLEDLFNKVLEMGGLVERQLENSVTALQAFDVERAQEVIQMDSLINHNEIEIDRLCVRVLARQQPTGSDLRLVVSAIRIAVDLERMGDEVVKIAKLVINLNKINNRDCLDLHRYKALIDIAASASLMLKTVLNAFARLDVKDSAWVVEEERRVDVLYKKSVAELKQQFKQANGDIECFLELVYALRASERLTDHARNIGEAIIYLVNGQDVRSVDSERLEVLLQELSIVK